MRRIYSLRPSLALVAALIAVVPASAQSQLPRPGQLPPPGPPQAAPQRPGGPQAAPQQQQQPPAAPIKPYQPLAVTLPTPMTDPSFDAFRKQLAEVANRKDRAGLAKLVVAQGFFWEGENGDKADKKKSGVDNLGEAVGGLTGRDPQGWEALAAAAQDPTLEALPDHNDRHRRGRLGLPGGAQPRGARRSAAQRASGREARPESGPGAARSAARQPATGPARLPARRHALGQDRLRRNGEPLAARLRPALLRQGRERLEDHRLRGRRLTWFRFPASARIARRRDSEPPARVAAPSSIAIRAAIAGARMRISACRCRSPASPACASHACAPPPGTGLDLTRPRARLNSASLRNRRPPPV